MSLYVASDGLQGISLPEWGSGEVPEVRLSGRDQRLAERLRSRSQDSAIDIQQFESGVSVRTRGSVGVVRFNEFELRIEPKLPAGHLQLFRMIEFAGGLSGISNLLGSPRIRFADHNLLDLVVSMLSDFSRRLLASGLRADYVEREGPLPALRGRFLPDRQVLDRLGLLDQVVCRYDEHEYDIPDNQLLALALRCGGAVAVDPTIRRRSRILAGIFEEICAADEFSLHLGRSAMEYDRMNAHYRGAHELAFLLLDGTGPEDPLVAGNQRAQSFLIDMSKLFERFVEKLLRASHPSGLQIRAQQSHSIFWDADRQTNYGRVRPDFLVESRSRDRRRLPLDAKYKRYSGPQGRKISAEDLSQAFIYAYAFREPSSPDDPVAVIVYPSELPDGDDLIHIEVHNTAESLIEAKVIGVGLHIPSILERPADEIALLKDVIVSWSASGVGQGEPAISAGH